MCQVILTISDDIAKLTVEITRIGSDINDIAYIGNYQKYINRTQLEIVSKYLQQIIELQKKILAAMFSEEDHSIISVEKKIEKLIKSIDSIGDRKTY